MKFSIFFFIFIVITFLGCFGFNPVNSNSRPIKHELWNDLVTKYVDDKGWVNYQGFIKDSLLLNKYLQIVKSNHPNQKNWSNHEQLAYWINAYNAFTIQLIIRNYPVKSIKDIAGSIPFINSPWDLKFIKIEGETYDLNNIEHNIIRKQFDEPRIHFALVCAAKSCPSLLNEAYTAQRLNEQLSTQAKKFIQHTEKNIITQHEVKLSRIFSWYKGDFTHQTSLIGFLNLYAEIKINPEAKITYLDYNWQLNEQ